jgi:hypothetical protein
MTNPQLQAGFAEVDITPPLHLRLAGKFFPRPIQGVLDPLFAHAMVLESGATRAVLISCDLLTCPGRLVEEVRNDVQEELGIPASHIAVFATHTHTGPYTQAIFGDPPDAGYLLALRRKIAQCVRLAGDRMEPCEMGLASTFEHNISFNRRYVMTDGLVRTHPHRGSDELSHAEGPIDPEVGVMCFRQDNGLTAGYFVNFACHPNVVGGNQVSADFPGALSRALKRQSGEACVALFGNGASGNVCQIDVINPDKEVSGYAWSERMGEILANDVADILPKKEFAATAILEVASRRISIPRRDPDHTPYHGTMFSGPTLKEVDDTRETASTSNGATSRGL